VLGRHARRPPRKMTYRLRPSAVARRTNDRRLAKPITVSRRFRSRAFWTSRGRWVTYTLSLRRRMADGGRRQGRTVHGDATEFSLGRLRTRAGIVAAAGNLLALVTLHQAVPTSHGELSAWSGLNPSIRTHGHPHSLFNGRTDELAIPRHNTWFQHESPIQAFDRFVLFAPGPSTLPKLSTREPSK
jgi:hypothetical protein